MKGIAFGVPTLLVLQASVNLLWPHKMQHCAPGCRSKHDQVRAGYQGILFAAGASLLAAIAGALL